MLSRLKKTAFARLYRLIRSDFGMFKTNAGSYFHALFRRRKGIVYLQSPLHGNVGDLAIAEASLRWLNTRFTAVPLYEMIYGEMTPLYRLMLKTMIRKDDVIVLHGGGNLGTWYPAEENYRSYVISHYHKNSIIVFPQSVFFSDDEEKAAKLKQIYTAHPDLLVCVRDEISLAIAKEKLCCRLMLLPDIVLNYSAPVYHTHLIRLLQRNASHAVLLCLRHDKERRLGEDFTDKIQNAIQISLHAKAVVFDTHIGHRVTKATRKSTVDRMLELYSDCELVVTDRFHGGIFSYITGTPCIVLESMDHKVRGGYRWLENAGNILLADSPETAEKNLSDLFGKRQPRKCYENEFDELADYIRTKIGD